MYKIPVAGGPQTGKRSLVQGLRERYPDAFFLDDPAAEVIRSERAKALDDPEYRPVMPWQDYPRFSRLAVQASVEMESAIPIGTRLVFQKRSVTDKLALTVQHRYDGLGPLIEEIAVAKYAFAFMCSPVGIYRPNGERRETAEEAMRTHAQIERAYAASGLRVFNLPAVPVEARVAMVDRIITDLP